MIDMCMFKKRKPLEYKDIEYSIKFMFADDDEIKRILDAFADAVLGYNKEEGNHNDNNL